MAGTDSTRLPTEGEGPAIILVEPQLGENIGMAARAMWNCGLTDLRLVRPRDAFPNRYAIAAASGADMLIEQARLFDSTAEAIADLQHVFATTARHRDMLKPVETPRSLGTTLRTLIGRGEACGVLFGKERTGLSNEDVVLAHTLVNVPLNPAYSSLNIAQAVLLIGYEWYQAADATPPREMPLGNTRPATGAELKGFYDQLDEALDAAQFYRTEEMRPVMWRNVRNIFQRAGLTEQEVRTLRGLVSRLAGSRK